ncbi:hypothetical protein I9T54_06025 [Campylobacter peloridis]|uniref:LPP20 family lipoprotein n=1 Tax=Campylobacter peloridis TaxID=488546 RepID=UPI001C738773|nr:LPP20 family lipoprotein [Campylobacter peloridis]MBX2079082.1 hypothetical protein [Campylobacter peloridis]
MVKKLLILFFTLICFCQAQNASNKESYGEGFGETRDEAIKNAINEALGKMEGLKQVKLKKFEFKFDGNFNIGYNEEIDLVTNGTFNGYEITELTQVSPNSFHAKVIIYKKIYTEKNLGKDFSLFILNTQENELSKKLEQELLGILVQNKKIKILDRKNAKDYEEEKEILLKDGKDDELTKLYNVLGADFILIISPKLEQIQNDISVKTYKMIINYRLVEFATRAIKNSNTLEYTLTSTSQTSEQKALKSIAKKIADDLFKHQKEEEEEKEDLGIKENYKLNEKGGVDLGF